MKSLFLIAVLLFSSASFGSGFPFAPPMLSSFLNEWSTPTTHDENNITYPMIMGYFPDATGHSGLSAGQLTAGTYSQVTGRMNPPTYTMADGSKIPVFAFANIDNSTHHPQPFTLPGGTVTLAGDVSGVSSANTVNLVGTSTAANVHSAELAANAATNLNTVSTIVKRDGSGNFSAGTITASVTGHASADCAIVGCNMSGIIDMGNHNISRVADPVTGFAGAQQAATRNYVDKTALISCYPTGPGGTGIQILNCSGLLNTDTIYAVSQSVKGTAGIAPIAHGLPLTGSISMEWALAPGANAVVDILVRHQ